MSTPSTQPLCAACDDTGIVTVGEGDAAAQIECTACPETMPCSSCRGTKVQQVDHGVAIFGRRHYTATLCRACNGRGVAVIAGRCDYCDKPYTQHSLDIGTVTSAPGRAAMHVWCEREERAIDDELARAGLLPEIGGES